LQTRVFVAIQFHSDVHWYCSCMCDFKRQSLTTLDILWTLSHYYTAIGKMRVWVLLLLMLLCLRDANHDLIARTSSWSCDWQHDVCVCVCVCVCECVAVCGGIKVLNTPLSVQRWGVGTGTQTEDFNRLISQHRLGWVRHTAGFAISENCWNRTILVKLLTFVDFCVFLDVSAFGWLL